MELLSALEGSAPRFVQLFVKAVGFLVRFGFRKNNSAFRFDSADTHPFVKVLVCRGEVQSELVQQVLQFVMENKHFGMVQVCEFLRPFLNYSILSLPFSDSSSSSFVKQLVSSLSLLCCSCPWDAVPVFKLLMQSLRYYPRRGAEDLRDFIFLGEYLVDSNIMVLKQLVVKRSLIGESQRCSTLLLEIIFFPSMDFCRYPGVIESAVELSMRLLVAHKDLGFPYTHEMLSAVLPIFFTLIQSELEFEHLSILKLLIFLLKWKNENDFVASDELELNEELLFIIPVLNLISSPSKSVKGAATDLLLMLGKLCSNILITSKKELGQLALQGRFPEISRPESIIFSLLRHLWHQDQFPIFSYFFINSVSTVKSDNKLMFDWTTSWFSQLREFMLQIYERQKNHQPISHSQQVFLNEMPLLIGSIAGFLIMHPSQGRSAVDLLASIGVMEPKLGTTLLLTILFYNNIFSSKDTMYHHMSLKLLGLLPSLASHSSMTSVVVQTILPMLHKDAIPVLYATATRLLCKTWEMNDRAFGSLQAVLLPKLLADFMFERNICISIAASLRDVCQKNPDRGVDLIFSVSACIESKDPTIRALGFQSLAHLCEADVIDFYTAWDVIATYVQGYSTDPVVALSVCLLLRWGAMDAEAYPEASRNVLQILWQIGMPGHFDYEFLWAKARSSAFKALIHYEVFCLEKCIPDLKKRNMELLISESNPELLEAVQGFEIKIMMHEHINRRRLVKEKRKTENKIEKLLDVSPRVIFSSGKNRNAGELPGAALLCQSFTPKDMRYQGYDDVHCSFENALVEIAASLQLSRNIFLALFSLQSWKPFMQRWMKAIILCLDSKATATVLDKPSKAANDILKSLTQAAEKSIPRSAENVALAMSALCTVLPPSAHGVKLSASKFLLNWLFQSEHEYRQWSAAISVGLISSCLHVTDHKQKFENITALIEVACGSKSIHIKGACGVGLGFSCQDLLTRVEVMDDIQETHKMQEMNLLRKIVRTLSLMTCQLSQSSYDILQSIAACFPLHTDDLDLDLSHTSYDNLEDDIWGVAGLVLGLGISIGAIYRSGAHNAVLKVKTLIMSWFLQISVQKYSFESERNEKVLSVGSCLVLPSVVAFCQRVEMMDSDELDQLLNGYRELIFELVSVKKSGIFHQSLLMASCVGAGNLLACILNEGVHPVEVKDVKGLMDLFRKTYSSPYPPFIHLGGMLGVVNAFGAGAGTLFRINYFNSSLQTSYDQKTTSYIMGPLLSNLACEPYMTSLMQDIFLVAQNSEDNQLQQYAAWAISFLRHRLWFDESPNFESSFRTDATRSQSFSDDNSVAKLSFWLMNFSGMGNISNINAVTAILKCLSQMPRLPTLDWGAIIRRCMRCGAQGTEFSLELTHKKGLLREECLIFALAHANQFDALLSFLDELSDFPRFQSLELNLQSCLLFHLADLSRVFSGSRLRKLFDDMDDYFSSVSYCEGLDFSPLSLLRVSFWKGLYKFLDETSLDTIGYGSSIEKCMEALFSSLPNQSTAVLRVDLLTSVEEWYNAIRCLSKARRDWLYDLLEVNLVRTDGQIIEVVKKIQARARLVKIGSFPLADLGKLKAYILNNGQQAIWDALLDVVAALQQAEGSVRQQWLVDAADVSVITNYPSTALQFLGLLAGSFCKYMPLLILDRLSVLSDLPVTLTALLSDPGWETVAEAVVSSLWASMKRIYSWVTHRDCVDDLPPLQPIDNSENEMAAFLLRVLHCTCVSLKDFLPLEKQLWLANIVPE